MIQAVLFDLGGTLHTQSTSPERKIRFAELLLERLADYGIDLKTDPEELSETLGRTAEEYKHHSEQTRIEEPAEVIWADWYLKPYGVTREQMAPIAEELSFRYDYDRCRVMRRPHLKETFDELKKQGLKVGIISNIISRSVVPHFLAEYGLLDYMDCLIMSSTTGIRKPDPGIFRVAEKELGLGPESLAYVGDTLSRDVSGCRNAGWAYMIKIENACIAHRDKGLENSGLKADADIKDLMEIPELIRKYNAVRSG